MPQKKTVTMKKEEGSKIQCTQVRKLVTQNPYDSM